jgi:hypothetical protein
VDHLVEEKYLVVIEYSELLNYKSSLEKYFLEKFSILPNNIIFTSHLTTILDFSFPEKINIVALIHDLHHQGSTKKRKNKSINEMF